MAINLITGFSCLFACAFFCLWSADKKLREKIERPKYEFLEKIKAFDEQAQENSRKEDGVINES